MNMKAQLLLIAMAALIGAGNVAPCSAQTPAQHLPPPVVVAPKPGVPVLTPAMKAAAAAAASNQVARAKFIRCPVCRGNKTMPVNVEVACTSCAGTGKTKSSFTKTEGDCNFCRGTGKVTRAVARPCPLCKVVGTLDAAVFEQFIGCPDCQGAKMIETNFVAKCTSCNGAGKIVKSSISSSGGSFGGKKGGGASVSQEQPCPFCGATGTVEKKLQLPCSKCYGVGMIPPPPPPPAAPPG